jgi:hypothetical protein
LLGELSLDDLAGLLPESDKQIEELTALLQFPADEIAALLDAKPKRPNGCCLASSHSLSRRNKSSSSSKQSSWRATAHPVGTARRGGSPTSRGTTSRREPMTQTHSKKREEARRLYLTGEMATNAEIAARLKTKPHTIGRWRREEGWDDLRFKIDRRAAEMFVEKIATDRVTLNVRHYRFWDIVLAKLSEDIKAKRTLDVRDMERIAGILDRAQRGQRLAKGMSVAGETEEAIRAEAQAENRRLIDTFIDSIKRNVSDEETRERIRRSILEALPEEEGTGTGDGSDDSVQ